MLAAGSRVMDRPALPMVACRPADVGVISSQRMVLMSWLVRQFGAMREGRQRCQGARGQK